MRQLFQNLISNSIKYTHPAKNPQIKIYSTQNDAALVNILVEDNGIGFNIEDHKKIFQLFQRLNNSPNLEGTGIGLAICKRIVENHNGNIEVASEPDKGTTFTMSFPIKHFKI